MGPDTLQNAKASLLALSALVKAVPIPEPFKSAVTGIPDAVLQIIKIVETAKGNVEDAKSLALYIATITDRTIRPLDLSRVSPAVQERIREFKDALWQIMEEITALSSRRPLRKWIVNYDRDASTLSTLKQKVVNIIAGIQLETVVATGHEVDLLYQEQQVLIRKQQEVEINQLITLLGSGDSGSSKKLPCLDGTRVSLLDWISQWIKESPIDDRRGLCLIGAAGRGKSSVGASVAQQERRSKRLGGDFYFMIDQPDRNETVIPVLARQLASWGDRRLRMEIASAIDEDRDIAQRALEVQFQKLIREPLETLADDPLCPPLVIILDGLDEYNNDYASRLLRLVGKSFDTLPAPVRFIIASRPEPHLLHHYTSDPLNGKLCIHSLDLEQAAEVENDIEAFFRQELPRMVLGLVKQPSNWPGEWRIRILVRLSGGLWIWAVTAARMLADPNIRDPEKQFDALLSSTPDPEGYGHNTDLCAIYSMILNRACPPSSHSKLLTLFQDVLRVLCVVNNPINTRTLASLLCPDHSNSADFTDSMRTKVLGYLQAVLNVPDFDDDKPSRHANPIQFVHKSFKDYLTDQARCEARFFVDIAEQHRRMAIQCLRRMNNLRKPNICNIDPTMLTSRPTLQFGAMKDLVSGRALIRRHISPALQYACENWITHVENTSPNCDDVYECVEIFANTRLLYWLEVMSLLEKTRGVVSFLKPMGVWLKARPQGVAPDPSESLTRAHCMQSGIHPQWNTVHMTSGRLLSDESPLRLFQDLINFVHEFEVPIMASAPHIYYSALPFTPSYTSLSRVYGHLAKDGPRPRRGCLQQWSSRNSCVAWSPDGQRITSGSQDGTLHQWDPSTGAPIGEVWNCHARKINCIAWSPDGSMVVSGSEDGTLQLWDSIAGARVGKAWKSRARCVAWSPEGKRIASASLDSISLWETDGGVPIGEPWQPQMTIHSLSWSPDGGRIVFASGNSCLYIWDTYTRELIGGPWAGHTGDVCSVAWLPDGKRIVSGSADKSLRMWDASTGAQVGYIQQDHIHDAQCISWSPDWMKIVSGSSNGTLTVWDITTREPTRLGQPVLGGHTRHVYSLALAPKSDKIVTASLDGTLRLWDTSSGDLLGQPERQTAKVARLDFSLDGKRIVSEDKEGRRAIWEIAGEESGFDGGTELEPVASNDARVLNVDENGWLCDPAGKRMFWLPPALRPIRDGGRVLAKGDVLAIEIPSVPIIDISSYASRLDYGSDV
ncbi:hypothetical protein FRB93_003312 [Tulasnella sp. JGI-2019a]|nr:hypothetical protein FRB93_003312 [Tulasnella sp. JGI-2019a]